MIIHTKLHGGFGNQIFMILNILSLSTDYGYTPTLSFDKKYVIDYEKKNKKHILPTKYLLFEKLQFDGKCPKDSRLYIEPKFTFDKVTLDQKCDYLVKGYFQSYKYFNHNIETIKKYLSINFDLVEDIKKIYLSFQKKKIITLHLRFTDYMSSQDYHPTPPLKYFLNILSRYNEKECQFVVVTDDRQYSKEFLNSSKISYIFTHDIVTKLSLVHNVKEDELDFYLLMLSDVKICSNSTFSLTSCYLNEMYNLNPLSEYYFPFKWFGRKGPMYNIHDLIPAWNKKFKIYDYEQEHYIQ